MSARGPRLPSYAPRQVVSNLGYTGRAADVAATAALDPEETFDQVSTMGRTCAAHRGSVVRAEPRKASWRQQSNDDAVGSRQNGKRCDGKDAKAADMRPRQFLWGGYRAKTYSIDAVD
jgi:hypothetical protein